jgi:ketosteroid isomerase-like protein
MTTDDKRNVLARYFRATEEQDWETLAGCLAPDLEWSFAKSAAEKLGRKMPLRDSEPWLDLLRNAAGRYDETHFTIEQAFGEGTWLCARVRLTAQTKKGALYDNDYAFVVRFDDDARMAEVFEFNDTAYAFAMHGM